MKVVWISHRADLGGAEAGLVEAAVALRPLGIKSHALLPSSGQFAESLASAAVPFSITPYRWWMSSRGSPRSRGRNIVEVANLVMWGRLRSKLRALRPDVVVTNSMTVVAGAIAARSLGIPHVWYIREFGEADHDLTFDLGKRFGFKLLDRLGEAAIVNSRAVGEFLVEQGVRLPISVVRYGVQIDSFEHRVDLSASASSLRLVQVATVAPSKGQVDAVRAVAHLARRGVDVQLKLVGPEAGAHGTYLRNLAKSLGVEDRVELTGFRSDPYSEVALADVALVCSRREAFGRATVEAMKLGKPVIGSRSGATSELVRDGWSGLLYEPANADDLAAKIETIARDRSLIREWGENGRGWAAAEFTTENYGADLAAVLERVVSTPG